MTDDIFNAAAEAEIHFTGFSYDGVKTVPFNATYEDARNNKYEGTHFIRIWNFDIVEHYTALLRDEFGILSLASQLENLELKDWQEIRIIVRTENLLDYLADAMEQELGIEKPFFLAVRNNQIHIYGRTEDFDKFKCVNDMTQEILARADYLGALDAVKVQAALKGPKAA